MTVDPVKGYPAPSVRRLPLYLHYLRDLRGSGRESVSCTHIARDLGLISVQVRKDLAITGIVGRPKTGYELPALIRAIEEFLGWNTRCDAFLVGAGCLGSALLGYEGFIENGLNIVAAFDKNPAKVGNVIHGKEVFSLDKLKPLAERMHVQIGILAVPGHAAQEATELVLNGGIIAIWNYSPVRLEIPAEGVICEDVRLSSSLALLTSRLKSLRATEE